MKSESNKMNLFRLTGDLNKKKNISRKGWVQHIVSFFKDNCMAMLAFCFTLEDKDPIKIAFRVD